MKPKESAGCHQTLSTQVGSGDETTFYMATFNETVSLMRNVPRPHPHGEEKGSVHITTSRPTLEGSVYNMTSRLTLEGSGYNTASCRPTTFYMATFNETVSLMHRPHPRGEEKGSRPTVEGSGYNTTTRPTQ